MYTGRHAARGTEVERNQVRPVSPVRRAESKEETIKETIEDQGTAEVIRQTGDRHGVVWGAGRKTEPKNRPNGGLTYVNLWGPNGSPTVK